MIYVAILLALLVFTALTVWASFIDLGEWHIAQGSRCSGIPSSRWPLPAPR